MLNLISIDGADRIMNLSLSSLLALLFAMLYLLRAADLEIKDLYNQITYFNELMYFANLTASSLGTFVIGAIGG
jgi:hypothetical protein